MDALKHVLHAIRLKPQVFQRNEWAAPWRVALTASTGVGYHLVEQGTAWLQLEGTGTPLEIDTGDLIVVSNTRRYWIAGRPPAAPAERETVCATTLISGEFRAEHDVAMPLFSLLPPLIHIRNQNGQPIYWLATALRGIALETQGGRPGHEAVVSRLMDILFIMVMRSWIDLHQPGDGGWLGALYDPFIGRALNAIHGQPDKPWNLGDLARVAALSRSVFSERFTHSVGEPPMKYLTRWRIQLATTWLSDDDSLTVEQAAQRVGYTSPFAFSKACKRLTGSAPSAYRRQQA